MGFDTVIRGGTVVDGTRLPRTERGFERRKYGADRRWHWCGLALLAEPS